MLSERARKLQKAVLQRNAAHDLKIRALNNLADLLKVSCCGRVPWYCAASYLAMSVKSTLQKVVHSKAWCLHW